MESLNNSVTRGSVSEATTIHDYRAKEAAWTALTDEIEVQGLVEDGHGPWNTPSFPVPKKKPGEYRLVEDFRALNDATVYDAHPLPSI